MSASIPLLVAVLAALPAPPFDAVLDVPSANVRISAAVDAKVAGLIQRGARVEVTGCVPSCDARDAWALLGEDGAIKLAYLKPVDGHRAASTNEAGLVHAQAKAGGADLMAAPDSKAKRLAHLPAKYVVALKESPDGAAWRERVGGGYVRAEQLRFYRKVTFQGVHEPARPIAFLREDAVATPSDGSPYPTVGYKRLSRFEVLESDAVKVKTEAGVFPRSAVGLAWPRSRPARVPADARWVHVSVDDQVLTAYEGDRWVFTTLVSSGKPGDEFRTVPGLFQVWMKTLHDRMHGDDYFIEEVEDVMFFDRGKAFHAAPWHDHYGWRASHGCVNLSPADAAWLFDWAPPRMPAGWHTVMGRPDRPALWVWIEQGGPKGPTASPLASVP